MKGCGVPDLTVGDLQQKAMTKQECINKINFLFQFSSTVKVDTYDNAIGLLNILDEEMHLQDVKLVKLGKILFVYDKDMDITISNIDLMLRSGTYCKRILLSPYNKFGKKTEYEIKLFFAE